MTTTLVTMLAERALEHPGGLYVSCMRKGCEATSLTYAGAWSLACRWAAVFAGNGLAKGDRVVLSLPNGQDFVGAFYGTMLAGGVPVATPPMRSAADGGSMVLDLFARMRSLGARILVVPGSQSESTVELREETPGIVVVSRRDLPDSSAEISPVGTGDDLALLQITSGTSGPARAVQLRHDAVIDQMRGIAHALALDGETDAAVSWLPLFHDMGLIGFLLTPAFVGRSVTLLRADDFAARPSLWVQTLSTTGATITGGPPSAYQLCARRTRQQEADTLDLSRVRVALVGAETVTPVALDAFAARFASSGFRRSSLMPTYGLAENGLAVTMPPLEQGPRFDSVDLEALEQAGHARPSRASSPRVRSFACVGTAIPGVEIAIVDSRGNELGDRRVGEIVVKGHTVMTGYFQAPDVTAEALRDGWLHTGDLGYVVNGALHVTGRLKEIVIVGGRNYSPEDLEMAAAAAPGVRAGRVVAVSVPDDATATEKVVILAETGLTDRTAQDHLRNEIRRRLTETGYPVDRVLLLPPRSIMTTASGKVMRVPCKRRFLESNSLETQEAP